MKKILKLKILILLILSFMLIECDLLGGLLPNDPTPHGNGSEIDYGTGSRNTFLVSMPLDKTKSWKEMAFLATVPAATKINNGTPSVIAVSDSQPLTKFHLHYLNLYKPKKVFTIGDVQGYNNTENLNVSSIDEVTCELARFWERSDTVVMSNLNDYQKSLSASALAGRLRVPLFFFDGHDISESIIVCLLLLDVKKVVAVGPKRGIENKLNEYGITVDSISNELEVVSWLKSKGHEINYFAVCNSYDRAYSFAPKSSLAAPLLAAARDGVVVPLEYESEYNTGFLTENTTTTRPNGAAPSADGIWRLGTINLNHNEYNIVLSRQWADLEKFHNQGNIDFNGNGNFGDDGEFVKKGDLRKIGNKTYQIDIDTRRIFAPRNRREHYSDIRFTYPHSSEIKNDIKKFSNALGSHPKYMAMIGLADALPYAQIIDEGAGMKAWTYHTDQPYAQVDSDKDYDIAMGRIVGEDASIFTMAASRSVTYDDLLDDSWKNRACVFGKFEDPKNEQKKMLKDNNYDVDLIEPGDGFDTLKYSIFSHWNHGSPFLLAPFVYKETESDHPTSPGFITTGGCRQGNSVIVKPYQDRLSTYSDYAAVKLARVGAIGYHAFSKFASNKFTLGRLEFLQAIFDGATLGEAHLRSINATQDEYGDAPKQIEPMMFYGDPGLKIYIPK